MRGGALRLLVHDLLDRQPVPRLRSRAQTTSDDVVMLASQIAPQCAPASERPNSENGVEIISKMSSKLPWAKLKSGM